MPLLPLLGSAEKHNRIKETGGLCEIQGPPFAFRLWFLYSLSGLRFFAQDFFHVRRISLIWFVSGIQSLQMPLGCFFQVLLRYRYISAVYYCCAFCIFGWVKPEDLRVWATS